MLECGVRILDSLDEIDGIFQWFFRIAGTRVVMDWDVWGPRVEVADVLRGIPVNLCLALRPLYLAVKEGGKRFRRRMQVLRDNARWVIFGEKMPR